MLKIEPKNCYRLDLDFGWKTVGNDIKILGLNNWQDSVAISCWEEDFWRNMLGEYQFIWGYIKFVMSTTDANGAE